MNMSLQPVLALLGAVLLAALSGACQRREPATREDDLCLTNLTEIYLGFRHWEGDRAIYPPTLRELQGYVPSAKVLVCPASGHEAGSFTNIEQWTDYSYFGNEHEDFLQVALVICPPENHRSKFGHVLWQDGQSSRLSSDQVRALIAKPWCMATNASTVGVERAKAAATARMPARFEATYTNVFKRRASADGPG
jgi:hypothetical protein